MRFAKKQTARIKRNPLILDTTQKEPIALYVPKSFINFILLIGILGGIIYLVWMSDVFRVKKIIYEGTVSEDAKMVVDREIGENIFKVNNFTLADKIKEVYPQAYTINVYKGLPDVLKVVMAERSVAMIWHSGGKNYLVDRLGVAFREVSNVSTNAKWKVLPVVNDTTNFSVKPGQRLVSTRFIDFARIINDNFSKVEGIKIAHIEVGETSFQPNIVTELGWKVLLDGNRSPEYQLSDLKRILDKHKSEIKEYVDLRIEGYGYWK